MSKKFKLWSIRLFVFVSFLFFGELVAYIIYYPKKVKCKNCDPRIINESVNIWHPRNKKIQAMKKCGKKLCFITQYDFDHLGRRSTTNSKKGRPIVLLGDSYTFGYGLDSGDTLAQRLSHIVNRPVYNYGFNGTGMGQLFNFLRKRMLSNQLPINSDFVLLLTNMMFLRDLPSLRPAYFPYIPFCERKEGDLFCHNNSLTVFPFEIKVMRFLSFLKDNSYLGKLLIGNFSFHSEIEQVEKASYYLKEFIDLYHQFFNGKIYIIEHPHSNLKEEFRSILNMKGIEVLHDPLVDYDAKKNYLCKCDRHPNKNVNYLLAPELKKVLKE